MLNIFNPDKEPIFINAQNYKLGVDKDLNEGLYEHLLFVIFADPTETAKAFEKAGIKVDLSSRQEKLNTAKILCDFARKGEDINGKLKNGKGDQVFFNVKDIIKSIDITKKELDASRIKIVNGLSTLS